MSPWIVVGVEPSIAWPTEDTEVDFRERPLLLRPATDDHLASVAMEHPESMSFDAALLEIRHFLSSLSWLEQAGIREVAVTGGSAPHYLGRGRGQVVTDHFKHDYLPDPTNSDVRLALAFYREAMSYEPTAYRVLNFFKIINILHPKGSDQIEWINANLRDVRDARANKRLEHLSNSVDDVGDYLYTSGRCAVAHAFSEPLVDPENIEDDRRLSADLPVLRALAELLIERELGVKSRHTVWREHLYNLEGFRTLLGEDVVSRLKMRDDVSLAELPRFPRVNVGVRDEPPLGSFVGLVPTAAAVDNGTIWLRCDSSDNVVQVLIGLAVADEYLLFDPEQHVAVASTQSVASCQARRDQLLLLRHLLFNGQLEIVETESGRRLGRTDAYVAQNVDMNATLEKLGLMIDELDAELEELESRTDA